MKKLHWLAILMSIVLLVIAGFQVYWLCDNYDREKKSLEVKAQALFRETVRDVQDSVIQTKLQRAITDSVVNGPKRTKLNGRRMMKQGPPRTARMLEIISDKMLIDSPGKKKGLVITINDKMGAMDTATMNQAGEPLMKESGHRLFVRRADESIRKTREQRIQKMPPQSGTRKSNDSLIETVTFGTIYFDNGDGQKFRISFDSLFSESVSIAELSKIYAEKLEQQQLEVPFQITHSNTLPSPPQPGKEFFMRSDEFGHFEGYQLNIGNSFSFLIKKIAPPILFSICLVGLAILAFVLLYRNLLQQHRLATMKNDLISNITHELKTPIATVGVAIEALKNFNAMQDPARTKEYLDISQLELQRLGLLVDKVLKLSMFESGKMDIVKEVFAMDELVAEVVNSFRLQLEKNRAAITVSNAGGIMVEGDRQHLQSVVFNLLDNSLKYNDGNVEIHVELFEKNNDVILRVTDNGIGIPSQYQQRIFEKFFRVPSGDTHNAKGHGLGLNYVAQVVQQHGGHIEVESRENKGSSFIITLPKAISSHVER